MAIRRTARSGSSCGPTPSRRSSRLPRTSAGAPGYTAACRSPAQEGSCVPLSASLLRRSALPRSRRSRRPTAPRRRSGKPCRPPATPPPRSPPSELGQRIARTAIDEFNRFGGHQIDANGRLFHFGLTEAEHEEDDGGDRQASLGHLGWWQVMKYWRALFGNDTADKLEVRGYRDASTVTKETQTAALLRSSAPPGCCAPPKPSPIRRRAKSCARRRCARQSSIPRGRRPSSAT